MPEDACNVDLGMPRSCTPLFGHAVRMKLLRVGGTCCIECLAFRSLLDPTCFILLHVTALSKNESIHGRNAG